MRRLTASLATLWISAHSMPTGAVTILVESDGDVINGSVGSVADLLAASGPDGISLREAITATNNDPDQYTMHFATAEIQLTSALPPLTGGHLTIEGPVTLRGGPVMTPTPFDVGLRIASSGNRLVGLTLEGFFITGVAVSPPDGDQPGMTLADNVIEGLTIRGVHNAIFLGDAFSPTCGGQELCPSHNTFLRNTVRNNTIESDRFGIIAEAGRTVGGVFDSLTITGNTLIAGAGEADGNFVPDVYAKEYGTLNLTVSKTFGEQTTVQFQAKNLTNPEIETFYDSSHGDVTKTTFTRGREYSLGVSIRF